MENFTWTVAFELSLAVEQGFARKDVFGKENRISKGIGHEMACSCLMSIQKI